MGVLTIPLGMGVTDNPIKLSPYIDNVENPDLTPSGPEANIMTEQSIFIMTEDLQLLTTE